MSIDLTWIILDALLTLYSMLGSPLPATMPAKVAEPPAVTAPAAPITVQTDVILER